MAGIAKLWKPVVNVTDLDEGERFWSAVSGLSPQGRHGQFSVLDADDPRREAGGCCCSWSLSERAGRNPLDFRVDDVAGAVAEIEAIGGVVVRSPGMYAPDGTDLLEWAVMKDPFGNEFCIIRYPLD